MSELINLYSLFKTVFPHKQKKFILLLFIYMKSKIYQPLQIYQPKPFVIKPEYCISLLQSTAPQKRTRSDIWGKQCPGLVCLPRREDICQGKASLPTQLPGPQQCPTYFLSGGKEQKSINDDWCQKAVSEKQRFGSHGCSDRKAEVTIFPSLISKTRLISCNRSPYQPGDVTFFNLPFQHSPEAAG